MPKTTPPDERLLLEYSAGNYLYETTISSNILTTQKYEITQRNVTFIY